MNLKTSLPAILLFTSVAVFQSGEIPAQSRPWMQIGKGADFLGTATDPADPSLITAVCRFPNIARRSTDGGQTFAKISDLPTTRTLIQMCSFGGSRIYAITDSGCCISPDAGRTWIYSAFPTNDITVTAIAAHPTDPGKVYAVGYRDWVPEGGGRMYRDPVFIQSADGGLAWTPKTIRQVFTFEDLYSIAVSISDPDTIYAGGHKLTASNQAQSVLRSTDGGVTWTDAFTITGRDTTFRAIAIDPAEPRRVYAADAASVYRTEDGGASWTNLAPYGAGRLLTDPANPSRIYLGDDNTALVSTNYGLNWSGVTSSQMAVRGSVRNIEIAPSDPGKVRFSTNVGLYGFSADDMATGIFTGFTQSKSSSLALGPSLLITAGSKYPGGTSLFKSNADGLQWDELICLNIGNIRELLIHPSQPDRLVALFEIQNGGNASLSLSDNGGTSWTTGSIPLNPMCLAQDPIRSNTIYAGGKAPNIFSKSIDFGRTWTTPVTMKMDFCEAILVV
ncbi:hypothetical protein LLG95_17115 [bacterium]|nr:hypothetical protein [bacterium]